MPWFCFTDSCYYIEKNKVSLPVYGFAFFVYLLISLQVTPNAGRINLSQGTPITWLALTVCLYSLTTSEEGDSWSVTVRQSVSGEHYEALPPPLFPSLFFSSPLYKGVILFLLCGQLQDSVDLLGGQGEHLPLVLNPHKTHSSCSCFGAWRIAKYEMDRIRVY